MRIWNLGAGDPLSLTLAADPRLGPTDYCDDQIWELQLGGGDPPAVALYTTFGLRARSLRIFPLFTEDDRTISDPSSFDKGPVIRRFFPNFLELICSPFQGIDVKIEFWVPQSKAIAGRIRISNNGRFPRKIQFDLVAQLTPSDGERMAPAEIDNAPCLSSQSDGLHPVLFLTGGPKTTSSPFAALRLDIDIPTGSSRQFAFCHAALYEQEHSFNLARELAAHSWDAETARIELSNAGFVEIYTGDQDWDIAFSLAQKLALNLFLGPTEYLPQPSFVFTRKPDQGFSLKGDGSDYNYLWNGQSPLESYYLAGIVLPSAPHLAKGLVNNYLYSQTEDGSVDWKPGLGGQRCGFLAVPILASLSWRIFEFTEDRDFLEGIFQKLLDFYNCWFGSEHDRDGDGVPERDHSTQAGLEDHPVFSRWATWAEGVEISSVENPALCAFLIKESRSLIDIARLLKRDDVLEDLLSIQENLQIAIQNSWNEKTGLYQYWDRDTHLTQASEHIGQLKGPGILTIQRSFDQPVRLQIHIYSDTESTMRPNVFIHGESISGQHRIERIEPNQFSWSHGHGTLTGGFVYSKLEQLEFKGINDDVQIVVKSVATDIQDQTNLLPLWAGIPDETQVERLVQDSIMNPDRYWYPFGIPPQMYRVGDEPEEMFQNVHLIWNLLIAEGMLNYGYREEVAEIVNRLMKAIIKNLKEKRSFQQYYDAKTGQGVGERNAISGLAPIGLFLDTLGVRLISSRKVHLVGHNPFPWPVTIKYLGISVLRGKRNTTVTFPDGHSVVVDDPSPQYVFLAQDESDLD
jgi:hypothetical protein